MQRLTLSKRQQQILYCSHNSGAKFASSRLLLVTETAYYVHIVLALRLPGVTVGYYLTNFAFYVQCLTVAGFHSQRCKGNSNFTKA